MSEPRTILGTGRPPPVVPAWLVACAGRAALLGAGFWALAEGDRTSAAAGVVTVVAATVVSLRLAPPRRLRVKPLRLVQLAGYVVHHSLRGGFDVALRAFAPTLRVEPRVLELETDLLPGPAQLVFTCALSLPPGSLCCGVEGRRVSVHVLAGRESDVRRELGDLEARIAAAFPGEVHGATDA